MALPSQINLNEVIQWVKNLLITFMKKELIYIYIKSAQCARFSLTSSGKQARKLSLVPVLGKSFAQIFVLT